MIREFKGGLTKKWAFDDNGNIFVYNGLTYKATGLSEINISVLTSIITGFGSAKVSAGGIGLDLKWPNKDAEDAVSVISVINNVSLETRKSSEGIIAGYYLRNGDSIKALEDKLILFYLTGDTELGAPLRKESMSKKAGSSITRELTFPEIRNLMFKEPRGVGDATLMFTFTSSSGRSDETCMITARGREGDVLREIYEHIKRKQEGFGINNVKTEPTATTPVKEGGYIPPVPKGPIGEVDYNQVMSYRTETVSQANPVEEPAPEPVYEEPAPEPVYEEPAPEPVYEEPAPIYSEPTPEPVYSEPAPEPVYSEPAPEPVYEEKAYVPPVPKGPIGDIDYNQVMSYRTETVSQANPVEEPAPEPAYEEPASEPVYEEPAPEPVYEELAPEPVYAEPTPEPVYSESAPEPVYSEPAPEPVYSEPAPEPVYEELAPEPVYEEPAPEPVYAESTPEPVSEPEYAEPTHEPTPEPAPEPEYTEPALEPAPEPVPEPEKEEKGYVPPVPKGPIKEVDYDEIMSHRAEAFSHIHPENITSETVNEPTPEPTPEPAYEEPAAEPAHEEPTPEPELHQADLYNKEDLYAEISEEPLPEVIAAPGPVYEEPIVEEIIPEPVAEEEPVVEEIIPEPVAEEEPVVEEIIPEPVVEEPVVEEIIPEPVVEEPVVEEIIPEPVVEEPVVEEIIPEPVIEEEAVIEESIPEPEVEEEIIPETIVEEEPAVEEPVVEEPVVEEPAVEEPVVEEPVVEEPVVEEPIAEEPAPEPAPAAPKNVVFIADELLKLKQLVDMGVLTQEEFDTRKKQLLNM